MKVARWARCQPMQVPRAYHVPCDRTALRLRHVRYAGGTQEAGIRCGGGGSARQAGAAAPRAAPARWAAAARARAAAARARAAAARASWAAAAAAAATAMAALAARQLKHVNKLACLRLLISSK